MTHQSSADPVYDYGLGVLRTAVPALWGSLASVLVNWGLPIPDAVGLPLLSLLAMVAWYAVWHAVEAHLPPWLTRLVLGANTAPTYTAPSAPLRPVVSINTRPSEPTS